jgi:MEDS: MEthanogen/methylotroph, DcmR Sensory domain
MYWPTSGGAIVRTLWNSNKNLQQPSVSLDEIDRDIEECQDSMGPLLGGPLMRSPVPPISIAGSQLGEVRHICAFFNSEEEEYRVLLPFIKEGFRCGDKAVHVVNPHQQQRHLDRLKAEEIDVEGARQSGQLDVRVNTDTYLRNGAFDQDRMLHSFEQMASGNGSGGFPLSRIVCRMDWASADRAHILDLVEFEARVDDVWQHHDDAVICSYHLAKFGGDAVIDIMRTHPMIIIGSILQQNPFYVPPDVFLREYRERRAQRSESASPGI